MVIRQGRSDLIEESGLFPVEDLSPYHRNPRRGNVRAIADSLERTGQYRPIVVNRGSLTGRPMEVLAGNHTLAAVQLLGRELIHAVVVDVDDQVAARIVAADNRTADLGEYDNDVLAELLAGLDSLEGTGYEQEDLSRLLDGPGGPSLNRLVDRFGAPPLSILSARSGEWQERKRVWAMLGLSSELGRDENLLSMSVVIRFKNWYAVKTLLEQRAGHALSDDEVMRLGADLLERMPGAGTSVFDPVLTELMYSWYSAPGARIIDPWAGGSVRGVVAAVLGREYVGVELRAEQIEANRAQLGVIDAAVRAGVAGSGGSIPEWIAAGGLSDLPAESFDLAFSAAPRPGAGEFGLAARPEWIEGDSIEQIREMDAASFDLAFGCPPYYDLEQYSDDPRDLSNLSVQEFDAAMTRNIAEVARVLRPDSFAVFVVGSVRDRGGYVLDMRRCMSNAAEAAGLRLVNDSVLMTPIGTAAVRATRAFAGSRTMTRVHQEVLVYVKGDRRRAAKRAGEVEPAVLQGVEVDDA